jgi:branched-chain amino acid transport system substrate-binding protein
VKAWVAWTNAHGGINGHPIKLYTANDNNDPAQAQSAINGMMNNNHIVALVGNNTSTLPIWAKLISDAGIPVIGGVAETSDPWLTNPDFYSTGTTVESAFYATQFAVKQAGFTKEAVLECNQVTACLASLQPIRNYAKTLGINLVYAQYASPTATEYTAQCLAMKTAGAQVVEAVVNDALLAANCKAQGYTPVYFAPDDDVTIDQIKATPSFEGASASQRPSGRHRSSRRRRNTSRR